MFIGGITFLILVIIPARGVDLAIWILFLFAVICMFFNCYAFTWAADPKKKFPVRKFTSIIKCNWNDFEYRDAVDLARHQNDPKVLEAKEMEQMKSAQKQAEALGWEKVAEEDVIDDAIVNIV